MELKPPKSAPTFDDLNNPHSSTTLSDHQHPPAAPQHSTILTNPQQQPPGLLPQQGCEGG